MRLRRRHERGATVVEAAFALPILLMFIFGLVDLGMWTFNSNQATHAAKDGARAAIVAHTGPCDSSPSASVCGVDDEYSIPWTRLVGRIEKRMDRDLAADEVTISCERRNGDPVDCVDAVVDRDRVRVEVDWTWDLLTPIAAVVGVDEGEASGVATMTIIGKPVGEEPVVEDVDPEDDDEVIVTPPPAPDACVVDLIKVGHNKGSNSNISAHTNGQLKQTIWVSFRTNHVDKCSALAVQVVTPAPYGATRSFVCDVCQLDLDQSWKLSASNEKIWANGKATLRIYNEHASFEREFQVDLS